MKTKSCLLALIMIGGILPGLSQIPKGFVELKGGTFIQGGGYEYQVKYSGVEILGIDDNGSHHWKANEFGDALSSPTYPSKTETVKGFLISSTEVTNAEYRAFVMEKIFTEDEICDFKHFMKKGNETDKLRWTNRLKERSGAQDICPDFNADLNERGDHLIEIRLEGYFLDPGFDDSPVLAVSYNQALAYCEWLTEKENAKRITKGMQPLPPFRLPTESEWEFAARGLDHAPKDEIRIFPWEGTEVMGRKGKQANIYQPDIDPFYFVLQLAVKSFPPNPAGIFDLAGNCAEWTSTSAELPNLFFVDNGTEDSQPEYLNCKIVKGGSYRDESFAALIGSRRLQMEILATPSIGFRLARDVSH